MANAFGMQVMHCSGYLIKKDLKDCPIDLWLAVYEIFQTPRIKLHQNIVFLFIELFTSVDCYKFYNEVVFDAFTDPFLSA